jgi:putative hydrolase of the HAD superfamily
VFCNIKFQALYNYEKILGGLSNRYKLGVISNEASVSLRIMLCAAGIHKYFDIIIASEETGASKPDPEIFLSATKILKLKPEEIAYVGDELFNDIMPSEKLGMNAVLYSPPNKYKFETSWRSYPELGYKGHIIRDLEELRFLFA